MVLDLSIRHSILFNELRCAPHQSFIWSFESLFFDFKVIYAKNVRNLLSSNCKCKGKLVHCVKMDIFYSSLNALTSSIFQIITDLSRCWVFDHFSTNRISFSQITGDLPTYIYKSINRNFFLFEFDIREICEKRILTFFSRIILLILYQIEHTGSVYRHTRLY